jgi:hypothetical protein
VSVLINKNKKMKKTNLLTLAVLSSLLVFTSCSKDDDHSADCHECHVAYDNNGAEIEVAILAADGGDDFCGTELENVEAPGYTHEIPETIVGMDTVPAGSYEVHCEEHAH